MVEFPQRHDLARPGHERAYSFTCKNVPSGSHPLTMRATDNAGAVTTSSPVGITVRRKR